MNTLTNTTKLAATIHNDRLAQAEQRRLVTLATAERSKRARGTAIHRRFVLRQERALHSEG